MLKRTTLYKSLQTIFIGASLLCCFLPNISEAGSIANAEENFLKKRDALLKFTLVGTYYSEALALEFNVITPGQEVVTRVIRDKKIIDQIISKIKIDNFSAGKYRIVIKNISSTQASFIGGIAASRPRSEKHGISKSHAFHINLDPNESTTLMYNTKKGFIPISSNENLLRWNPFDWL